MRVAILTASDRCSRGDAVDESGPGIAAYCREQEWDVIEMLIVPDRRDAIAGAILRWADDLHADVVLTTGGTGFGPRDITPEATQDAVDRLAPGIAEALRAESMKHTPRGMLSRGVAGLRGRCLVINLPGSPTAVLQCMAILTPVLAHAVSVMGGSSHDLPSAKREF
jgi:molybdenum cofactor synthesis domain-containing protein